MDPSQLGRGIDDPFADLPVAANKREKFLIAIGNFHAQRQGANSDDTDDCSIMFVEDLYQEATSDTSKDRHWTIAGLNIRASHHAQDFVRKESTYHRRTQQQAIDPQSNRNLSPEASFAKVEFYARLLTVIDELPPNQRDLIVRHHLNDESALEIAKTFNLSEKAVEQRLHRAREALRKKLKRRGLTESELRSYLIPQTD